MKDLKTALATKNGYSKERYTELVREKVKEKYPNKADEIAILRKEIAVLRSTIETLIGKPLPSTTFAEYNNTVESIKTEAKAETGIV